MTLPRQRFTQYPAASASDYADATTFLIANSQGTLKQATLENLNNLYGCGIKCASLVIPSADVLQLNSTPQTIVAAQGSGKAIEVLNWSAKIANVTTPYATNTFIILTTGGDIYLGGSTALLTSTVDKIAQFARLENPSAGQTQIIENAPLQVSVETGNPTAGDGDIEVFVLYRIINV